MTNLHRLEIFSPKSAAHCRHCLNSLSWFINPFEYSSLKQSNDFRRLYNLIYCSLAIINLASVSTSRFEKIPNSMSSFAILLNSSFCFFFFFYEGGTTLSHRAFISFFCLFSISFFVRFFLPLYSNNSTGCLGLATFFTPSAYHLEFLSFRNFI